MTMRVVQVLAILVCALWLHKAQSAAIPTPDFQCDARCSSADALNQIEGLKASLTSVRLDRADLTRDQLALQELLILASEGCANATSRSKSFTAGGASDSKDRNKVQRVIRSGTGSVKSRQSNGQASCPEVLALEEKMRQTVAALDLNRTAIKTLEGQDDALKGYLASVTDAENKARGVSAVVPEAVVAVSDEAPTNQIKPKTKRVAKQRPNEAPIKAIAKQRPVAVPDRFIPKQPSLPVSESRMVLATSPAPNAALAGLILARQSRWLDKRSICQDALPSHVAYPVY